MAQMAGVVQHLEKERARTVNEVHEIDAALAALKNCMVGRRLPKVVCIVKGATRQKGPMGEGEGAVEERCQCS